MNSNFKIPINAEIFIPLQLSIRSRNNSLLKIWIYFEKKKWKENGVFVYILNNIGTESLCKKTFRQNKVFIYEIKFKKSYIFISNPIVAKISFGL